MKKYSLTDEHRAMLKPWAEKWIANAMSTRPIEEHEKPVIRKHVKGLYEAAGLTPPPDHRIVFVPSPFVARFAGGFAAWIWYCRRNKAVTDAATDDATRSAMDASTIDATIDATLATVDAATYGAVYDATHDAANDATADATRAFTRAAMYAATIDATNAATYRVTHDATDTATRAATIDATDTAMYNATKAATYNATRADTINATDDATIGAMRADTRADTKAATYDVTRAYMYDATDRVTRAATIDATIDATDASTYDVTIDDTRAATGKRWYVFPENIGEISKRIANRYKCDVSGLLECANKSWQMYRGGNSWSGWCAMISFFRYVAKLPLDYTKWDHYEKLAELSGFRIVHEKFCIISDRPSKLTVDDQNRPHCDDGPFCQWRDGSALYAIHGVRVPAWVVEHPEKISIDRIKKETDLEVQRVMIERYGTDKYLMDIEADVIDTDLRGIEGGGARCLLREKSGRQWLACTDGSTERVYHLSVSNNVKTCKAAHEELCGFSETKIKMEG